MSAIENFGSSTTAGDSASGASMPERNILRVYRQWTRRAGASVIQYYVPIDQQTAGSFGLGASPRAGPGESVEGCVDAILDQTGNIVTLVNERFLFETFTYTNKIGGEMVGIAFPEDLVQRYGLRDNEYVDVTFERIRRSRPTIFERIMRTRLTEVDIEIYPRVLRYGEVAIKPQAFGTIAPGQIPDRLIRLDFGDQFCRSQKVFGVRRVL